MSHKLRWAEACNASLNACFIAFIIISTFRKKGKWSYYWAKMIGLMDVTEKILLHKTREAKRGGNMGQVAPSLKPDRGPKQLLHDSLAIAINVNFQSDIIKAPELFSCPCPTRTFNGPVLINPQIWIYVAPTSRPFNEMRAIAHDMSFAPALSKMHIQVPRKALTIECLARANDPTRAIGSARQIYSLLGLYKLMLVQANAIFSTKSLLDTRY